MDWQKFRELRTEMERPFVMAHRGASALLPENTLAAFQQALADGADILETDLRFTADDEIVLIHDETLDRTVEGTGLVRDYTLKEIQQLKVKQGTGAKDPGSVPTLRALIEATKAQVPLALELKDPLFIQPGYGEKLIQLLRDYGLLEQCVIISFNLTRLQAVKHLYSPLAAGWITMSNPSPNHPVEFVGPFWPLLFLNPFYTFQARRLGKIVCPLDPLPEARLGLYLKLGLDVILTDNPAKTLNVIAQKKGVPVEMLK